MKRWPLVLGGAIGFWFLIFLLAKFPPSEAELLLRYAAWSRYSGVFPPANFAAELPFPLTIGILSLVSPVIPVTVFWFRAVNLVLVLLWLVLVWKLTQEFTRGWFLIFACTSLWLVWTLMASVPAALVLVLITGMFL